MVISLLSASCTRRTPVTQYSIDQWYTLEAERILNSLSLSEKTFQMLMTGIDGKTVFSADMRRHFENASPGFIILFRYNIASTPEAIHSFISSSRKALSLTGSGISPAFAIDHEGGDVVRLRGIASPLPSAHQVSSSYSADRSSALYKAHARQLSALGIDINLAPVVELSNTQNSVFLGTRLFAGSSDTVVSYSRLFVNAFQDNGVAAAIKHFPGNTSIDPHFSRAELDYSYDYIMNDVIGHFKQVLEAHPVFLLVSNTVVPAIDTVNPFCLSEKGIQKLVRNSLSFDGLVITDDISMQAIAHEKISATSAALMAIRAGCDVIMTSDANFRVMAQSIADEAARDESLRQRIDESLKRILVYKLKYGIVHTALEQYAHSRQKPDNDNKTFNDERFYKARTEAAEIVGN